MSVQKMELSGVQEIKSLLSSISSIDGTLVLVIVMINGRRPYIASCGPEKTLMT